jgi:hypothetical protein
MTISYPLTYPGGASDIAEVDIVMSSVIGMSQSIYTYEQQLFKHAGERWEMTVRLNPLNAIDGEPWRAWLASLRGSWGTFNMGDPSRGTPRGTAATTPGSPKVRTGAQTGYVLDIYAAPNGAAQYLLPGDYIQLGTAGSARLHRVLKTVVTSANGTALLDIWPALRSVPASGAALVVNSAVGVWRLAANAVQETIAGRIYELEFSAVEAL